MSLMRKEITTQHVTKDILSRRPSASTGVAPVQTSWSWSITSPAAGNDVSWCADSSISEKDNCGHYPIVSRRLERSKNATLKSPRDCLVPQKGNREGLSTRRPKHLPQTPIWTNTRDNGFVTSQVNRIRLPN